MMPPWAALRNGGTPQSTGREALGAGSSAPVALDIHLDFLSSRPVNLTPLSLSL